MSCCLLNGFKRAVGIGKYQNVKGNWNLPNDCKGTISYPPENAVLLVEDQNPWEGIHRFVQGRKARIEFFWVKFDEPQMDVSDGPYLEGEVEAEYIHLIQ